MKYFALHDESGDVHRVVGVTGERKPETRGLIATPVPDVRHRVRLNDQGEFEPYMPEPEDTGPSLERARARKRIARLEEESRRPLRELALDPSNAEARRRLEAIDAEIAELRKGLA